MMSIFLQSIECDFIQHCMSEMQKGTTDEAFINKCLAVLEGGEEVPPSAGNQEYQEYKPQVNDHERSVRNPRCGEKSATIFLHGLGPSLTTFCKLFAAKAVGLSSTRNILRCPAAPKDKVYVIPPTIVARGIVNSWFNFWCLPSMSVRSPFPCESKKQLDRALGWVEKEIEDLIENEGVCSENIVVAGMSQGGALTIWTALYSKYKLGGFVPIVTWLPLRKQFPVQNIPNIVNRDTPILHLNGLFDPIVTVIPAGSDTKKELSKVFTNYKLINRPGTHTTTFNPLTQVEVAKWLAQNTNLQFSSINPIGIIAKRFGGLGNQLGGGGSLGGLVNKLGGGGSFLGLGDRLRKRLEQRGSSLLGGAGGLLGGAGGLFGGR